MNKLLPLILLLPTLLAGNLARAEEQALDDIVAVVNDDTIMRSELERRTDEILAQLRAQGRQPPPRSQVEPQVLERMIVEKLQADAAHRAGIEVGNEMLAQAISSIAKRNGLSVAEFRDTLKEGGLNFDAYREQLRRQILLQRFKSRAITSKIKISDREIDAWLARHKGSGASHSAYHLQHILIATPEGADSEQIRAAKRKAEDIVERLRNGADFSRLAVTESDGRQALDGGDLGWIKAGVLPDVAADAIADLPKGGISAPVRGVGGFHIFKVVDVQGPDKHLVKQTHARHILIRVDEQTSNAEARRRLEQLRERIVNGEDFAALARAHSDDKGSALNGGDLKWISKGDVVPAFAEAMEKLKPGEISQPFRTDFGWHIVQVLERREHDDSEEQLKQQARDEIRKRKAAQQAELLSRRLRDEAYVDIRLNK